MWHTVSLTKGVCPIFFVRIKTLITENTENLVCAQKTTVNPKQEQYY